jgi:hypothetical protein
VVLVRDKENKFTSEFILGIPKIIPWQIDDLGLVLPIKNPRKILRIPAKFSDF